MGDFWLFYTYIKYFFFHEVLFQESPFPTGKLHYKVTLEARQLLHLETLQGRKDHWDEDTGTDEIFPWSLPPRLSSYTSEILATCKLDSSGNTISLFCLRHSPTGSKFLSSFSPLYLIIGNSWENIGILVKLRWIKGAINAAQQISELELWSEFKFILNCWKKTNFLLGLSYRYAQLAKRLAKFCIQPNKHS